MMQAPLYDHGIFGFGGERKKAAILYIALRKSRGAYQDFLGLWKDADPDIPVLRQAKVEYAKLQ